MRRTLSPTRPRTSARRPRTNRATTNRFTRPKATTTTRASRVTVTTTIRERTIRRPVSRPALTLRPKAPAVLSLLVLAFVAASAAHASDRTLKRTVATWSHTVALDARGISLSASRRHPRRMTLRARKFRVDSLRARRAVAAQHPSTARGRRAKRLAMRAFGAYAAVGAEWARAGRARLRGQKAVATRHASLAARYAQRGNRLIRSAGRLLR